MKKFIVPMLLSSIIITGCAYNGTQDAQKVPSQQPSKLEYTLGSDDWSVVTSMTDNPKTLEAYQFAIEHPEVLDYMPCYCGCFEEDGHTSNTNCFVDSVNDKVAVLDTMGFGWGVCVDIAREAKQEYEKGTDLKTIRANIDQKYEVLGTPPTPTPMPKG